MIWIIYNFAKFSTALNATLRIMFVNKPTKKDLNQNKVCNAEQCECYLQPKTKGAVIYNYTVRESLISSRFFFVTFCC